MAQTLKYVDGLIASFPDNTAGLIEPENMRDFVASFINGRGFLVDETNVTLPILDGTWTAVNPLLLSPNASTGTLWVFDGNNFGVNNYAAITGLVIPTDYAKLFQVVSVLDVTKASGGADNYQMQMTKNGVGLGLAETVQFPAAGTQTVTLLAFDQANLSLSDTYGVQVQGVGTTDDLSLNYFNMSLTDSILLEAPTP